MTRCGENAGKGSWGLRLLEWKFAGSQIPVRVHIGGCVATKPPLYLKRNRPFSTPQIHDPWLLLTENIAALTRCAGSFLGCHSDCRCQFFRHVAYLRPQNFALGVALSAPPPVVPAEWCGSDRGILPKFGQVGASTCSSVSDRQPWICVLKRLCEKNHKVRIWCSSC